MTTQNWFYIIFIAIILLFISTLTLAILFHNTNRNLNRLHTAYIRLLTPYYICMGSECHKPVKTPQKEELCLITEDDYKQSQSSKLHYEGSRLSYQEMSDIASQVIAKLPSIKSTPEVVKLITETAIAESDGGYFINTKGVGGLGITQVNYKTAKYLLSCLDENDLAVLNQFRDDSLSLKDNLIHNLYFNMAMCALYYYHRKSDQIYHAKSIQDRASLWKEAYNTSEGKGTPSLYIKRVRSYQE